MTPRRVPIPKKPDGVWVALEFGPRASPELIGVFDSFDLAQTACAGVERYAIANIKPGVSYRGRIVNWRSVQTVK